MDSQAGNIEIFLKTAEKNCFLTSGKIFVVRFCKENPQ